MDAHRHCFAAWYITLQNHTLRGPKTPPISAIFDPFGNYPRRPPILTSFANNN